jgi:hypothetical protein
VTKRREFNFLSLYSSLVLSLSLSLEALAFIGASWSSGIRVYPLEIGDYGFERNLKGESLPTTCIPSRDEL